MQSVTYRLSAPAKVNLFLTVGGRRADGYHEILTVFEPIPLADEVTVTIGSGSAGKWAVRVRPGPSVPRAPREPAPLPLDLDNLAGRAVIRYAHEVESLHAASRSVTPAGVEIIIEKRIPIAAGLGGGSSDAAAVLWALQEHFGHPLDSLALRRVALDLGSDVPFFLYGERAIGRSRGEDLVPIPPEPGLPLVVGLPAFSLGTADVYRRHDCLSARGTAGASGRQDPERPPSGTDRVGLLREALAGGRMPEVARALHNDLEPAAVSLRPEIRLALETLRKAGCLAAIPSGSGPSVFGLAQDEKDLGSLAARAGEWLSGTSPGAYEFVAMVSGPGPDTPGGRWGHPSQVRRRR